MKSKNSIYLSLKIIFLILNYVLVYTFENNVNEEKNDLNGELCEKNHSKSYCNFKKYGKKILIIIICIIIIGPILIAVIIKIYQ